MCSTSKQSRGRIERAARSRISLTGTPAKPSLRTPLSPKAKWQAIEPFQAHQRLFFTERPEFTPTLRDIDNKGPPSS